MELLPVKMVPPAASPATQSTGERRLFEVLARVDLPGWTAYHSLSVSEHEYKRWGELDFVLLSDQGLFAIEVKGGGVRVSDGIWTFTDRYGEEHTRSESPFKQAESGLMGLRRRLEEELPLDAFRSLPIGYGVAFPQTDFGVVSVEWAPETVLDRSRMASPEAVARWLRNLARHWQSHTLTSTADPALVRSVGALLRPEFDRVPSLRYRLDDAVAIMDRLTEEQYRQLDFIEEYPRLVCEGGAGTGKTFLAAEFARREARRGKHVLFTCWSETLAGYLASRVTDGVEVRPFGALASRTATPADVLIVDEAQDLLTLDHLAQLDYAVAGGLQHGRWAIFLDPNLQSAIYGTMEADALELLREYGGLPGHLRWNCRNTEPVILQTRLLTGADLGNPSAGYGPPVEYEWFTDRQTCARMLERELDRLTSEGVSLGDVTILSPVGLEESAAALLQPKWARRLTVITPENVGQLPLGGLSFARIVEFKGLENRFVLMVDIGRFDEEPRDLALIYVGMSRARAGLWIAIDERLRGPVEASAAHHIDRVVHGARPS